MVKGIFQIIIMLFPSLVFCNTQDPENDLILKLQKNIISPTEYYISNICDSRKVKGAIGTLIQADANKDKNVTSRRIFLKDGTIKSIDRFISGSLSKKENLRPVTYDLKILNISEDLQVAGTISGRIEIVVTFQLNKHGEKLDLVEYKGGSTYIRSVNNQKVLEQLIGNTIINSIRYFDKWINLHVSTDEKLANKLSLTFLDYPFETSTDTLFYSKKQKLSWTDFRSIPNFSSRFAAEIFPFFSFEQNAKIDKGIINIELVLKTYLVRSFSWVKYEARTPYTLNHEQRHFDIVKLIVENFKNKIKSANLTVDNYQGVLAVEYLESLREMNRMQVMYDSETSHGTNSANQKKWNDKIDDQLEKH